MTEFAFEGGYRGERQASDMLGRVQPIRMEELAGLSGRDMVKPMINMDNEVNVFRSGGAPELLGKLARDQYVDRLMCAWKHGRPELEAAERIVVSRLRANWGAGSYRVASLNGGNDFVVVVGPLEEARATDGGGVKGVLSAKLAMELEDKQIQVKDTVWIELSREGPFKVIAPYVQPTGVRVKAHHPDDAPNEYEKVCMTEGLWLCQDAKGKVHILAEGVLTKAAPVSRFTFLGESARWAWAHREAVLWAGWLAGAGYVLWFSVLG